MRRPDRPSRKPFGGINSQRVFVDTNSQSGCIGQLDIAADDRKWPFADPLTEGLGPVLSGPVKWRKMAIVALPNEV